MIKIFAFLLILTILIALTIIFTIKKLKVKKQMESYLRSACIGSCKDCENHCGKYKKE